MESVNPAFCHDMTIKFHICNENQTYLIVPNIGVTIFETNIIEQLFFYTHYMLYLSITLCSWDNYCVIAARLFPIPLSELQKSSLIFCLLINSWTYLGLGSTNFPIKRSI